MFLRRIARPIMMMAKVKETTGMEGFEVVPNAREVLINLYKETLEEIEAVPELEGYHKDIESCARHRLNVLLEEQDRKMIEKKLGCGQLEKLIHKAQDQFNLICDRNGWRPFGVPDDYDFEVFEKIAPAPKHIPLHRPGLLPEEFYKTMDAVTSGKLEDTGSKKDEPVITSR